MEATLKALAEAVTPAWKPLYRLGAWGALSMTIIIVVQLVFFIIAPPPLEGSAADWFAFFAQNRTAGLVGFELLLVISVVLSIPLILALYTVLRCSAPSLSALYLVLGLIGVVCFVAARPAIEMLSLSDAYAAAGTGAERAMLLSAGEAAVAVFHGSAFYVSYVLGSLTGLIVSAAMLKSNVFGRAIAYLRIGSSVCDFGLFIPVVGTYIAIFSVFFLFAWNLLVARRLFQLARQG
jgi:hypothetical protein